MKSKFAIAGFILGLISSIIGIFYLLSQSKYSVLFIYVIPITSVVGIILSIVSFLEIKKKNLEGKGFGIVGLILSILSLLMLIYGIAMGIAGALSFI